MMSLDTGALGLILLLLVKMLIDVNSTAIKGWISIVIFVVERINVNIFPI